MMERTMKNRRGRGLHSRLNEYGEYGAYGDEAQNGGGKGETMANVLGWFSIGLGAVETAAPGAVARFLGIPNRDRLIRSMGLREITAGIGILTRERPARWVWGRVAGDVVDLAMLGAAVPGSQRRDRVGISLALVTGIMVLDVLCAKQLASQTT